MYLFPYLALKLSQTPLKGSPMSFSFTRKTLRSKSLSKTLFTTSAASVLSTVMLMGAAQTSYAQTGPDDIVINDCADIANNPGVGDAGLVVTIDIEGTCGRADGDFIELDSGSGNGEGQDNVTIIIASGTTLTSTDTSDEDTVIFVDNAENNTGILVEDGAALRGANGVIFLEGDEALVVNRGDIIGTGAAEEGVIYIDRDTDGDVNTIVNEGTGRILALEGGPAIGIEVLLADGADDAEDIGVQDALEDFPTIRIVNRVGGQIRTTGIVGESDDNDAINIAGNRGSTGGFDRECLEGTTTNCNVNLRVINSGTISSNHDDSGTAAITFEDDAIFHGAIINRAGGVITGTRNGIRIADVVVDALTAEHTGQISNFGDITGTGASSRGIDLEGDGITISNNASGTISGLTTGIEIGAGSSGGVDNSGMNNVIFNRGVISGGSYSIDSNSAEGSIRIVSLGGTFDGDIRGSVGNADRLFVRGGPATTLTHDVLQGVEVRVDRPAKLIFEGDRTIDGSLLSQGRVEFDLADTQTVTGNVNFTASSTVELTDTTGVAAIGDEFTLISVGGTLTNNATLDASQAIEDTSFLLDFDFVASNDLVVEAVAAGSGTASAKVAGYVSDIQFANAGAQSFGESVLGAFVAGGLNNTATFSNLGGLGTAGSVGTALTSLAPDFSGNLVQNVFNTVQGSSAQVDQRLNDLNCNTFVDSRATTSLASDGEQKCQTFAESGAWVQSSRPNSTQGSLSLSAPTYFNNGSDQDSLTMTYGYDHAVDNSTIVGFSGTYTESQIDEDSYAVSSTELDVLQFNAYAGHRIGNAHLVTKASYSYGEADTRRQSFDVIKSEVEINGLNLQGVANYNVNLGQGYYLQPEAGLHYNKVSTSAYSETGGLNLNVDGVDSNVLDGRVGMTLGARKVVSDSTRADVYVTGALRNDFYGSRDDIGYNFAGQSGSLAVNNLNEFAVQALAGVNVLSGENFSFGAAVNSEFSGDENAVGGSVQTKLRW